jgi:hypothetical protein
MAAARRADRGGERAVLRWATALVGAFRSGVLSGLTGSAGVVSKVVEDHKGIRRGLVIWSATLITWVTVQVFRHPDKITTDVVAALTAVIGLLSVSIGFYHWSRNGDDASCRSRSSDS